MVAEMACVNNRERCADALCDPCREASISEWLQRQWDEAGHIVYAWFGRPYPQR